MEIENRFFTSLFILYSDIITFVVPSWYELNEDVRKYGFDQKSVKRENKLTRIKGDQTFLCHVNKKKALDARGSWQMQ